MLVIHSFIVFFAFMFRCGHISNQLNYIARECFAADNRIARNFINTTIVPLNFHMGVVSTSNKGLFKYVSKLNMSRSW